MSSVDQRIVQMEFNNRQFENGIQTSLKTLDKLKEGLNLSGSAKHLSELQNAGSKFNLDTMGKAIDSIASRFSTMGIVGMAAIANLTNSGINMAKRLVSSLTIDQVSAGWEKYGQKTASVQTIMNSTGLAIGDVNKYLDKLMWFSDETSYSFTDMTAALGQMTSSGGDIKKLIPLITGVANATAFAGKGSAEFSRVMYNLNQSYGAGSLQLMDWKSVQLSGVASKELMETFIKTGEALGKIKKKGSVTTANFATTLKDKWADKEVMEKAFGVFGEMSEKAYEMVQSGEVDTASEAYAILSKTYDGISLTAAKAAQEAKTFSEAIAATKDAVSSGWMKSFDIIFGNYEEAKVLWTDLANGLWEVFASGSEARNALLQGWKDLGGRTVLISTLGAAFNNLSEALAPIGEAFREIFEPLKSMDLFAMTVNFEVLIKSFKIGEETAANLKRTFKGLFALIDIGLMAFKALARAIFDVIKFLLPAGDGILSFTGGIGDFIVKLRDSLKASNGFSNAVKKVGEVLKPIAVVFQKIGQAIADTFSDSNQAVINEFGDKVGKRFAPLVFIANLIKKAFEFILNVVNKVAPLVVKMVEVIAQSFVNMQNKIVDSMKTTNHSGTFDIVNAGLIGLILFGIKKFIDSLTDMAKNSGKILSGFAGFFDGIKGVLGEVKDTFKAFQTELKAAALLQIAFAIAILVGSLVVLAMIDSEKLTKALVGMGILMTELFGAVLIFDKLSKGSKFKGLLKVTFAMVMLALAVSILASAMKKLADLDMEQISRGLIAIGALSAILVTSAKALSQSSKKLIKGAFGLVLFAVAINLLATSVKKLGELDVETLKKGLISVGILCLQLVIFMKVLDGAKMSMSSAVGILILAAALNLLYLAVKNLGSLDEEILKKGLVSMGLILLQLGIFTQMVGGAKKMVSIGVGLAIVSAAMMVFVEVVKRLGSLPVETLTNGILSMGAALLVVAIAMRLMPKNILVTSAGLLITAGALMMIAEVLYIFSRMKPENILKSLVTLAGALTIIVVAMHMLKGALLGAAALLVISHSLLVLAGVLVILGAMPLWNIIKGLAAMAGVLAIISIAAKLLMPAIPALIGLAFAMALIGAAVLMVGAGLLLFSAGVTALAAAAVVIVNSLDSITKAISVIMVEGLKQLGHGLLAFVQVLSDGAVIIANAVKEIALKIIDVIIDVTPKIVGFVVNFLVQTLEALADGVPKMVNAGMRLIVGILQGIADNIQDVVTAGMEIMSQFMLGVANKLPEVIDSAFKVIISFINGLANAIRNNYEAVYDAVANLIGAIIEAIFGLMWKVVESGGDIIDNIITGAKNMITDLWNDMVDIGKDIIKGMIEGVASMGKALWQAAKKVVSGAVDAVMDFLDMSSPSKLMMEIGEYFDMGLIKGINYLADDVADASENVGVTAIDSVRKAISRIGNVLSDGTDFDPVITPVIDLTNIDQGIKAMDEQFGKDRSISLSGTEKKAISAVTKGQTEVDATVEGGSTPQAVSYVFNQNNYSPKALSRLDIYRQTKNQFSAMKGVVAGT